MSLFPETIARALAGGKVQAANLVKLDFTSGPMRLWLGNGSLKTNDGAVWQAIGTFGGALAHADPAGDLGAVALALECEFNVASPNASRTIAAADFFQDYLTTALAPDEILTSIRVPKLGAGWSSHYEKFNRVAQAWSIVAVAALVRRENGSIAEARIGLTNMASTPLRSAAVESALTGADATPEAIGAAAEHAAEGTNAPSDLSGKADYREHLARVLTKRAVLAATGA